MGGFVPQLIRVTRTGPVGSDLGDGEFSGDSDGGREVTPILESQARESMHTEWTDEKHSLYLKSMEASFVNQLYNSADLLGWRPQEDGSSDPNSSRQMHASTHVLSGQFMVLRDGCWERVNFQKDEPQISKVDGSHLLSANPWIRRFRSGCRHQAVTSNALVDEAALATTSNQFSVSHSRLCRQDKVGSNTEVSDQNFVDVVVEKEMKSKNCSTKRMRTSVAASSNYDQVVPFGNFPVIKDATESRFSSKE